MGASGRLAHAVGANAPALLVALALVLRLALVLATPEYVPSGDAQDYHLHGAALAQEGRYPPSALAAPGSPAAFRPPGYPYLAGAVYELAGVHVGALRVANALLGAVTVALLFLVARELWGRRAGIAAAALGAFYPPLALMSGALLAENLFVPLVLATVLACLRARRSGAALGWVAAAGGLAGAAALTRTNGLVLLVPVVLASWAGRPRGARRALAAAAAGVAAAALVLAPWTVRNLAAFDQVVAVSTQTGVTLAGALNATAAGEGPTQATWRVPRSVPELRGLFERAGIDEAELDARLGRAAVRFAFEEPRYVLEAVRLNTLRTLETGGDPSFLDRWDAERDATASKRVLWVAGFWTLWALAAWALLHRPARRLLRAAPPWLWLVPLLLLATTAPLLGNPRYRLAADPFVVLAAASVLSTARSGRGRERVRVP